jgi:general secretion pathway protein D
LGTNSDQILQQALRNALAGRTNAAVPAATVNPVKAAAGTNLSAPPPVLRNTPRALPATSPDRPAITNVPAAVIAPPPRLPVPGLTAAPVATNSPLDEPLPQGMIDFRAADLSQVLDIYSMMVNRTILRPATLPAPTITLTTRGQLTVGEGIQALQAVLALNGIVMVNVGEKFVKAVPEAQGGSAGGRFDTNSAAQYPDLGQFVTHVVQLKYAKPSELVPVLTPFVKIPNAILAIDTSQMLVLRDYAENVKRMLELIQTIDVAIPSVFLSEVIPIKYGKASDIASALNSLSSGGGGTSVGGGGTTGARSSRTTGINRTGGAGGYPGQQGQTTPGMVTPPGGAGTPTPAAAGNSFSSRLQNIINRASGSGEIQVLGQTKIISDERTNSLLIYAGKDDMKTIKEIIAKLDVVLAQVLIEAAIIEVDLTASHSLGLSYLQHPQSAGNWTGVGAVNPGNMLQPGSFVLSGATNATTSSLGSSGFSYLMSFGQDLDVAVTAAAADSHARILQRPRIQTSHNEPASLFVGTTQPYPTSSYYGGGAYGGYSSIQQMQIGVTLQVTPLINPDGLVVMDISMQIDGLAGSVTIENVGDVPITTSKQASAKVSVRDHDTVILGGLIYSEKDKSASGVPVLMDIPLLGYLFRNSSASDTRNELIVLIRPTVLPTPEIAALAATAEKNKMPGVRATEKEVREDEQRRLKQMDKANLYQPMEKP